MGLTILWVQTVRRHCVYLSERTNVSHLLRCNIRVVV